MEETIIEKIKTIIESFESIEAIHEIWEIGSRDGKDAAAISITFPRARVKSFEPNPDTFQMVEAVSQKSHGRILALNIALSDSDGDITFNKIDTSSTITTWPDGNPGASSIFIASKEYDIETYFQIPITVQSQRAKTLIEDRGFATPNLIWMDVQGAEGLVIKGFEDNIGSVDFIFVELSLKPLYLNQPLASEIIKLLSRDFYWYSNLTNGSWQFDAFFINKKYRTHRLRARNILLMLSLKSNLRVGIEYSFSSILKRSIKVFGKPFFRLATWALRRSDSKILGFLFMKFSKVIARRVNHRVMPRRIRQLISLAQASDPLKNEDLPTIDIAIPCHKKDFDNLFLVIQGARANVKNPIRKVVLITPEKFSLELKTKFPDCQVLTDENVLGVNISKLINDSVPYERKGWITQQVIKFQVAIKGEEVATLILDADTILLKPRIWLSSGGKQILCVAAEYHLPYKKHQRKVFGGQNNTLSFVTHHQLMKRDSLQTIFGQNGEGLPQWINLADFSESSAVSEYDTYGEWLISNRPNEIAFAKWNNFALRIDPNKYSYAEIQDKFGQYHSISNHSYLK
jgi:FkbM family methyltransferase